MAVKPLTRRAGRITGTAAFTITPRKSPDVGDITGRPASPGGSRVTASATQPSPDGLRPWRERYADAAGDWAALRHRDHERVLALIAIWEDRYEAARSGQHELTRSRKWRGGPRTLLAAIGVQDRELCLTAGLAWLLRPDGHHGLGPAMLDRLLGRLGIDQTTGDVRITCEESRGDNHASGLDRATKADLVVYARNWTIVCEAKTYAREQDRQLDRLYHHWKGEAAPRFLFLTRSAREPVSAVESREHWRQLTWGEIAELAQAAIDANCPVAAGIREYVQTVEVYHRV